MSDRCYTVDVALLAAGFERLGTVFSGMVRADFPALQHCYSTNASDQRETARTLE